MWTGYIRVTANFGRHHYFSQIVIAQAREASLHTVNAGLRRESATPPRRQLLSRRKNESKQALGTFQFFFRGAHE